MKIEGIRMEVLRYFGDIMKYFNVFLIFENNNLRFVDKNKEQFWKTQKRINSIEVFKRLDG